jgi:hypothetical protein
VPGVEHGNATSEVDEAAALHVPELGIAGISDKDFVGLAHAARYSCMAAGEKGCVGDCVFCVHGFCAVVNRVQVLYEAHPEPSMYTPVLISEHCAGLESCTGLP